MSTFCLPQPARPVRQQIRLRRSGYGATSTLTPKALQPFQLNFIVNVTGLLLVCCRFCCQLTR